MKAAFITKYGDIDDLEIGDLATPEPKENEVQIKIAFAAINPVDWKIISGLLKDRMKAEFPIILGWDAAGIVSKVGSSANRFKEGDEVYAYCRKEVFHDGSFAEYICLDEKNVAKKPKILSLAEAASIPLTALTAWQSLYDTANIQAGETVLIHAGAGGVGSIAIQLAKLKGCRVITTASPKHHDYLKSLGVDQIIDYTKEELPKGFDVIFDTVGGETLKKSYEALKEGGRLVSLIGADNNSQNKNVRSHYVFVKPNGQQLEEIASLFEKGKLKTSRIEVFKFEEIKKALKQIKTGHTQGKLVVQVS